MLSCSPRFFREQSDGCVCSSELQLVVIEMHTLLMVRTYVEAWLSVSHKKCYLISGTTYHMSFLLALWI